MATIPDTLQIAEELSALATDDPGAILRINRAVTRLRQLHQLGANEEIALNSARESVAALTAERDQLSADKADLTLRLAVANKDKDTLQAQIGALTPDDPESVRAAAITTLMTSTAPSNVATRAFIRDLYTAINDVRESLNLPRESEESILPRVITGVRGGLGDPIPPTPNPIAPIGG